MLGDLSRIRPVAAANWIQLSFRSFLPLFFCTFYRIQFQGIMFLLCQRKFDFQLHKDFPFHLPKSKIFSCKLSTLFESAYKCLNYIAGHTLRCECVWQCVCVSHWLQVKFPARPAHGQLQQQHLLWLHLKIFCSANDIWIQLVVATDTHSFTHTHTCIHAASPPCVCVQCGCINKAFSCRRTTKITRCKAQSTVHIPAWWLQQWSLPGSTLDAKSMLAQCSE